MLQRNQSVRLHGSTPRNRPSWNAMDLFLLDVRPASPPSISSFHSLTSSIPSSMLLFLIFFPRSTSSSSSSTDADTSPSTTISPSSPLPAFRDALIVVSSSLAFIIAVFLTSILILARFPTHAQRLADVLGILSTVLASIQYLPQLYTTWRLQNVLSLSIPMMLIQTPGSFLWSASLAARLGWEGWSAWAVYLVTGCLQGVLLGMGIAFEVRDWRKRKEETKVNGNGRVGNYASVEGGHEDVGRQDDDTEDERMPLLRRDSPG